MIAPQTLEHLNKALGSAEFVAGDLQAALKTAGPVAGLIILPLITKAAHLRHEIDQLATAVNAWGIDVAPPPFPTQPPGSVGTPGPWRAIRSGTEAAPDWIVIGGPDDHVVAGFPDVNPARVAADAQTIAAAPALLAMVRAMIPVCDDSTLQHKAQRLADGLQLPGFALVPLGLLERLTEHADDLAKEVGQEHYGQIRNDVMSAQRLIAQASAGT